MVTSGHLPELIDIIVAEKAKLFICAVGVPPKWAVDKLHAGGWSKEKIFNGVQGGILRDFACSILFIFVHVVASKTQTCNTPKTEKEMVQRWYRDGTEMVQRWYRYQSIRPAAPLFSSLSSRSIIGSSGVVEVTW